MNIAGQLVEWSRILEDTSNVRFTADLFYEAYNQASEYLCLYAPRKLLAQGLEVEETVNTDGTNKEYTLPTPANSEFVRRLLITLTVSSVEYPCIETPLSMKGITAQNSYYTSTDTHPRYVRHTTKIEFLHTPVTSLPIIYYYIKKPVDVASGVEPEIPLILQRVALRMAVEWTRWTDEQITHNQMMKSWNDMVKQLEVVQEGD